MPVRMRVRWADVGDAAAIAAVHVASWQGAYPGLMPQEYLDGLTPQARLPMWERGLATATWPQVGTLVAETDAGVVGFAHAGRSRDEDTDGHTGEVHAIYVVPEAWGTGAGRRLMAAAVEALAAAGYRAAVLWVLDGNARARRFYAAAGWAPDGATRVDDSFVVPLSEVRYRRAL